MGRRALQDHHLQVVDGQTERGRPVVGRRGDQSETSAVREPHTDLRPSILTWAIRSSSGRRPRYPSTVLLLLPPSEGKTAPSAGLPVDLRELSGGSLTRQRRAVLTALLRASRSSDALAVLKVGPSLVDEVRRNRHLRTAPAAPAGQVYTGVLYEAAGLDTLAPEAADRADAWVRTVSALWGLVTPSDRIPAYRLSMGAALPDVGPLARAWRGPLARVLDPVAAERLVVDCRSVPYAAAWPGSAKGPGHIAVTVLRQLDGRRSVVSHSAKHTRGVLTRHLLVRDGPEPLRPCELLDAAGEMVGGALLDAALREVAPGRHVLELVVS